MEFIPLPKRLSFHPYTLHLKGDDPLAGGTEHLLFNPDGKSEWKSESIVVIEHHFAEKSKTK